VNDEELPRDLELMADEALQGLCPNEWAELDRIRPPSVEREAELRELELVAAEVACAEAVVERMPATLTARIVADSEFGLTRAPALIASVVRLAPQRSRASVDRVQYAGWLLAALVVLGFWIAWPSAQTPSAPIAQLPVAQLPVPRPGAPVAAPPSLAERRQALLQTEGVRQAAWVATKDPSGLGASGDVVWNAHEQKGFMRFHGLAKNDRQKIQYQLWIFDKERDAKHPVDGGVFDVGEDGELLVAIDPRVPVHHATLFAITIEPPGGVVVSKRERIVVTAALPPT